MPVTRARESHPPRANCYLAAQCGAGAHTSCSRAPSRRLRCWLPAAAAMTRRRSRPVQGATGKQGPTALSKTAFITQADAVCGEANAALSALDTGTAGSDPKLQATQELQITRSELQSLQSLNPPDREPLRPRALPLRAPGPGRGAGRQEDRRRPGRRPLLGRGRGEQRPDQRPGRRPGLRLQGLRERKPGRPPRHQTTTTAPPAVTTTTTTPDRHASRPRPPRRPPAPAAERAAGPAPEAERAGARGGGTGGGPAARGGTGGTGG